MTHNQTDFETQIADDFRVRRLAEIREQRDRNPFRLTDAGMRWLVWLPIAILVLGIAVILSELHYAFLAEIYLPKPPIFDPAQLPTI